MASKESGVLLELYQAWSERISKNPSLAIEDLRSMFDGWGAAALEPEEVTYKSGRVGDVEAIWALPQETDGRRVIIYTHGGGFVVGSADSHRKMAGHLAKALECNAVVLNYRLAPESPFPAQIYDVVSAYGFLIDEGYEPKNIIIAGDSAGGNLALSSVLKIQDLGLPLPGAVIAYSPWLDMALRGDSLDYNSDKDILISRQLLEGMVGMFLGETTHPLDPFANPLESDLAGFPPVYINAGGDEALLSDAEVFHSKAKKQGVKSMLSVVPGMQHVFPALSGRAPEVTEELKRIAIWYKSL